MAIRTVIRLSAFTRICRVIGVLRSLVKTPVFPPFAVVFFVICAALHSPLRVHTAMTH